MERIATDVSDCTVLRRSEYFGENVWRYEQLSINLQHIHSNEGVQYETSEFFTFHYDVQLKYLPKRWFHHLFYRNSLQNKY